MAQSNRVVLRLETPPDDPDFGCLIEFLLAAGVRPPTTGKVGEPWGYTEFSDALRLRSKEGLTVRRWRDGRALPRRTLLLRIEQVLFGPNPDDYADWRAALRRAIDHGRQGALSRDRVPRRGTSDNVSDLGRTTGNGASTAATAARAGFIPVRVPRHFHGREDVLAQISAVLSAGTRRIAVHGLNGVGKTIVAAAYATEHAAAYDTIGWIDAATPESCRSSLANLGTLLKLDAIGGSNSESAMAEATLAHFAATCDRILLIYDDAAGPVALHRFLPRGDRVDIVITSNSPNWRAEAVPLELAAWTPEASVRFLDKRLGPGLHGDALALAVELGGLPIALEIAGAFCERRRIGYAEFLRRARDNPDITVASQEAVASSYSRSIKSALQMSIAGASEDPRAAPLLDALCMLAPVDIAPPILSRLSGALVRPDGRVYSADDLIDATAALRNYSLIIEKPMFVFDGQPASLVTTSLHQLVRTVARQSIDDPRRTLAALTSALERSFPALTEPAPANQYGSVEQGGVPCVEPEPLIPATPRRRGKQATRNPWLTREWHILEVLRRAPCGVATQNDDEAFRSVYRGFLQTYLAPHARHVLEEVRAHGMSEEIARLQKLLQYL